MAKKLEVIIKENINIGDIAKAIRQEGYKISNPVKIKGKIPLFAEGVLTQTLRSASRFSKLKDGWVKDEFLGIDWGPSSDKRMNWEDAEKHCANLGGRLPERFELASLIDDTKFKPAVDKDVFPDTVSDYYWSGTTYAYWTDGAWIVYFIDGYVYVDVKTYSYYVRPVRSSQ